MTSGEYPRAHAKAVLGGFSPSHNVGSEVSPLEKFEKI